MAAITNVTVLVGATNIFTAAESRALTGPLYVKNVSSEVVTLIVAGSDSIALDPGEPQHVLPGQLVTGTSVGGAAVVEKYSGIIPTDESASKAIAAAALPVNIIGTITVVSATGAAAIAATTASTKRFRLICVTCHLSAGPTTSEDLTVNLDALDGAAYDTVLKAVDLSLVAATDFVFVPDGDQIYEAGDQVTVAYANTDTGTYGLRIVIEEF